MNIKWNNTKKFLIQHGRKNNGPQRCPHPNPQNLWDAMLHNKRQLKLQRESR